MKEILIKRYDCELDYEQGEGCKYVFKTDGNVIYYEDYLIAIAAAYKLGIEEGIRRHQEILFLVNNPNIVSDELYEKLEEAIIGEE